MSTQNQIETLKASRGRVSLELISPHLSLEKRRELKAQHKFIQEQIDHLQESEPTDTNLPERRARDLVA